jgi:hypothetical protein
MAKTSQRVKVARTVLEQIRSGSRPFVVMVDGLRAGDYDTEEEAQQYAKELVTSLNNSAGYHDGWMDGAQDIFSATMRIVTKVLSDEEKNGVQKLERGSRKSSWQGRPRFLGVD